MKKLIVATLAAFMIAGVSVASSAPGDPQKKRSKSPRAVTESSRVDLHVTFSSHDVRVIREYYAPRYRRLPPGLQKKYARTGTLPPGWQKKMEPLPSSIERDLVVLPSGYRRGVIDGHAVIYQPNTQVIIDVAVLF